MYYLFGPPMTRTLLNWSELLDQYQGKSVETKKKKLKKWSEVGKHETRYSTNDSVIVHHTKSGISSTDDKQNAPDVLTKRKMSISELFYNELMQDTEPIPALAKSDAAGIAPKFSERDILLFDLLEMNSPNEFFE